MNTNTNLSNSIINIVTGHEPNTFAKQRMVVHKLLFDSNFMKNELEIEKSLHYSTSKFNPHDIRHGHAFVQHVMERHGAAPLQFREEWSRLAEMSLKAQLLTSMY